MVSPPKDDSLNNRKPGEMDFIAFEGGAAFGLAYPSAMYCLEKAFEANEDKKREMDTGPGFKWPVRGVSGTSIGATFAYLFALGYSAEEVCELAVRDRLFSKVFEEKLEYGRVLAAASDKLNGKTRLGWYGDSSIHRKDHWKLNDLLKASTREGLEDENKDTRDWAKKLLDAEMIKLLKDEGLITPLSILIAPALKILGLPDGKGSIEKGISKLVVEVLVDALLSIAGDPQKRFFDEFRLARLSEEINKSFNTKMKERFFIVEQALGDTPVARVYGWFPLLVVAVLLLRVDRWYFAAINKRTRGKKNDFLSPDKLDEIQERQVREWVESQEDDGINRNHRIFWYNFMTMLGLVWRNLMTDQNFLRHWKSLIAMTKKLGYTLVKDDGGLEEFFKKLTFELVKLSFFFLTSPILHLALKAVIDEGGLMNGQKIRDLLVFATFNKCSIQPDPDRTGAWKLVRRPQTLVKTLNNLTSKSRSYERMEFANAHGAKLSNIRFKPLASKRRERKRFRDVDDTLFAALTAVERKIIEDGLTAREDIEARWKGETDDLAELARAAQVALATDDQAEFYPVEEQFRIIEEELTFEKLHAMLGIDLVCTSANYTTSSACYWRRSLTPDFPVIEAARTAGAFPGLFKPTAIAYRPASTDKGFGSAQDQTAQDHSPCRDEAVSSDTLDQIKPGLPYTVRDWFYDTHYRGYFNDAGVFNNLPIHAFNGMLSKDAELPEGMIDPAEFHMPHESLQKPLNSKVLGIELSNQDLSHYITKDRMYRPPPSPFARGYKYRAGMRDELDNRLRSFSGLLGNILNALYAMSGKFRRLDPEVERAIVPVIHGNIAMWDMKPNMPAIRDCYGFNIRRVSAAFGFEEPTGVTLDTIVTDLIGPVEDSGLWDSKRKRRLKLSGLGTVL